MKIALIGLGRMGGSMARRLLAKGHDLRVFDPNPAMTEPLRALGAWVAADLHELCKERDVVITMLPSDDVLRDVVLGAGGLRDALAPGGIHMVSGTHGIKVVQQLMGAHAQAGQILLACTVLGRPERAIEGKLGIIAAGPQSAVDLIGPALAALGETHFYAGENPLSSVAAKIANNFILGCAIEAIGEGMALVRKYQVDPALFFDVLTKGLFDCTAYRSYGDLIAKSDWGRVGAAATIGLKDAQLAFEAAEMVFVPLPSGNVWRDHLLSACGRGETNLDWAVMAREQFRASGLE